VAVALALAAPVVANPAPLDVDNVEVLASPAAAPGHRHVVVVHDGNPGLVVAAHALGVVA